MSARYSSFILRCWTRDGQRRIDVEHVQSGQQTLESSMGAVVNWLDQVVSELENAARENAERQKTVGDSDAPLEMQDMGAGHARYRLSRVDG